MTVILHFVRGPKDGGWKRTSSRDHKPDKPITHRDTKFPRGKYVSVCDWELGVQHITLIWQYHRPKVKA
jgi:hypothetical protein